jgi:hypothetical protein
MDAGESGSVAVEVGHLDDPLQQGVQPLADLELRRYVVRVPFLAVLWLRPAPRRPSSLPGAVPRDPPSAR